MSELRTILIDPQSHSIQSRRTVFTIPRGMKVKASKIRVCNFQLSNKNGNQIYFNRSGVYSILSSISIVSLQGTQIDRLTNMEIQAIRMLHLENASQYSVNQQLSAPMCNSIYINNLGQADLTCQSQREDASLQQLYIDVSFCLKYLQARTVLDEGCTLILEYETPDVLGFDFDFINPPALAVDEFLTMVPSDPADVVVFAGIVQDKIIIPKGANSFEKRLNSFYNQMISNVYYLNIGSRRENRLINAIAPKGEELQVTINGMKLIPLKGIDHAGKKLGFLQDFSGGYVTVPGYDSTFELLSEWKGFHNPNNGLDYGNKWSYGCFNINKFINNDFTLSYKFDDLVADDAGHTLLILAETIRTYDRVNDRVGNLSSNSVPS